MASQEEKPTELTEEQKKAKAEQEKKAKEIQEKFEDINRLWLDNESPKDIVPVVDELFDLISLEDKAAVLSFLPPKLCAHCFVKFLDDPPNQRTPEIAKVYMTIIDELPLEDSAGKRSKVYLQMYKCLTPAYLEDAHKFLVKYLSTFNKVDETADVEGKACEAVLNCLKLPIWKFDEVMDLVPVRGLRTSKNNESKLLLQLLELFCNQNYTDWMKFYNDNKSLVDNTWKLEATALTEKIRLLSLCRLAHNSKELSFADIAGYLSLNEDEVEAIVVKAVGHKLMTAKIDQVQRKVHVSYSHHAVFTTEQWRHLQDTLATWNDNVSKLLVKFDTLVKEEKQGN